jgi:hypothetical protein
VNFWAGLFLVAAPWSERRFGAALCGLRRDDDLSFADLSFGDLSFGDLSFALAMKSSLDGPLILLARCGIGALFFRAASE